MEFRVSRAAGPTPGACHLSAVRSIRPPSTGVSWQVTPTVLGKMLQDSDPKKVERVTNAFLKMKKFDIAALKKAYEG